MSNPQIKSYHENGTSAFSRDLVLYQNIRTFLVLQVIFEGDGMVNAQNLSAFIFSMDLLEDLCME